MPSHEQLFARFRDAGQGHVFSFLERASPEERASLLAEASAIDLDLVATLGELLRKGSATECELPALEPPEVFPLARTPEQREQAREAVRVGEERLAAGAVGFVLVAGGQGSRLGFEGPKGIFPIGPVSGCSLFEWHARRLLGARERLGAPIAWYVMTSATNDASTREFFERHRHFGLERSDVTFFQQQMLPALDLDGRILLRERHAIFLAPNGHGGTLEALASSGALADARRRGIHDFSYFQVDNPLARPTDPLFLGLHALEEACMSSKVVDKRDAAEKVGVIGRVGGKLGCIEYSDLPDSLRHARHSSGQLLFRAGNIAMHVLRLEFVEDLTRGGLHLPWHLARKKMSVVGPRGEKVEVTGVKFETFVFDALASAERSLTLEVDRALEFSPVKNASGEDSPASARADLTRLFHGWVRELGLPEPPRDAAGLPLLEVDPRLAEDEEQFERAAPEAPLVEPAGHIYR
jgi:UDP-N-acetylglucosamine/UDP-N-acetylgalactosamine diphosphorylase